MRYILSLSVLLIINSCDETKNTNNQTEQVKSVEQAVIIHFNYGFENLDNLYQLEDELDSFINEQKLGEYDGHEIAIDLSDGFLYMYSQDVESLFKGIKPILDTTSFMRGAKARMRFGPPEKGVKEKEVQL